MGASADTNAGGWRGRLLPTTPGRTLCWFLAVAFGVVVVVAGWRWRQISVYPQDGAGSWGMSSRTWKVGKPIYVGMSYEKDDARGTITIGSVRPNVVQGSADAKIHFYVCTIDPAEKPSVN